MREFWLWFKAHPLLPWVLAFWVGGIAIPQHGCQLELPRMLTMRAMGDHGTFQIGRYLDWTDEWAKTPDGRYYNNRAPGPTLVPFPVFYLIDRIVELTEGGKVDDQGRRPWPGRAHRSILSFLFQSLPFGILVMLAGTWLYGQGVSLVLVHAFALAALLGNTAALFMNNFSGHGLTASFALGCVLAVLYRRWHWVGFCYGFALLCDYGTAVLLPPLLVALIYLEPRWRTWIPLFVLGGVLPGILWIWYHVAAFGSPFIMANHYQNPMYQDVSEAGNFLNIFKPRIDFAVLLKLLFGAERGILPTQPWVLVGVPWLLYWLVAKAKGASREWKLLVSFAVAGFLLRLALNACYGGWFAGNSAGPRYLSETFPILALAIALVLAPAPKLLQGLVGLGFAAALVFRGLVFAVNPMAPLQPLWVFYWLQIVNHPSGSNWLRLGIYWALLALAYYAVKKRNLFSFGSGGLNAR